jgi:hypothetical protein
VLVAGKGFALGGLLTLVVVGGLHATAPTARPGASEATTSYPRVVDDAVTDHHCSHTGLGGGEIPASALIRTTRGKVRQVSFDVGWKVYTGRRPGTLLAVCQDEPDRSRLVATGANP